jgi:hypothetical protein
VYEAGTQTCDAGGYYGSFAWSYQDANPYEINIDQTVYLTTTDHCTAYYCVDVITGAGGSDALVSWSWMAMDMPTHLTIHGDDGYTPTDRTGRDG